MKLIKGGYMKKLVIILSIVLIPNLTHALPKCKIVYYETYRGTKSSGHVISGTDHVSISTRNVECATVTIENDVGSVFLKGTTITSTDANGRTRTKTLGVKGRLRGGETYTTNICAGKAAIEKVECEF